MKEPEMERIAGFISRVIKNLGDSSVYEEVGEEVKALCDEFPLYVERQK
jgi:glycine/serine hydroxymethyltransferase